MDDPFDLKRFLLAQENDYERALQEIMDGRKRSHWIWYIFPQVDGLGFSTMSKRYAVKNSDEARAYLAHPILGMRLKACIEAVLTHQSRTATEILGSPDDVKLRSSATLFASVSPPGSPFHQIIEKYFEGRQDAETLRLLGTAAS